MNNNTFDWNEIRTFNGSQEKGFEEFICQLAHKTFCKNNEVYERFGTPDGGIECIIRDDKGAEKGFQAKYFTSSLGEVQFKQIDNSVKTAIDSYPYLTTYYIAIPINLSNSHNKGKTSSFTKWNNHLKKWQQLALSKKRVITFVRWDESAILEELKKKENEDLLYFFFNQEIFTDDWFIKNNESALLDLGARYSPQNNIDLPIYKTFDAIFRTSKFNDFINQRILRIQKDFEQIKDKLYPKNEKKVAKLKALFRYIQTTSFCSINNFATLHSKLSELNKENIYLDVDNSKNINIFRFQQILSELNSLFVSIDFSLAERPYLLIYGEGGIGKSHMLGDMVSKYQNLGYKCLFLLGQYFINSDTPWNQILHRLQLKCNTHQFLGSLNSKALSENKKIIIIIDALNEAYTQNYWVNKIPSFINEIQQYENLGVVLSVRTEYEPILFSNTNNITKIEHRGFAFDLDKAIPMYFKNYKIQSPIEDLIFNKECKNPLFLQLLCKTYEGKRIPSGLINISETFDNYFQFINSTLANKYNYSSKINLVKIYLEKLVDYEIVNNINYIDYEEAYKISYQDEISKYFSQKFCLLDELISQNILGKTVVQNKEQKLIEGFRFIYEKFENYCMANKLIDKYKPYDKYFIDFLEDKNTVGPYFFYLYNKRNSVDFFSLISNGAQRKLLHAFILSLNYYDDYIFDSKTEKRFIKQLRNKEELKYYFSHILGLIINGKTVHSIKILHRLMFSLSMKDRDKIFIPYFYDEYTEYSEFFPFIDNLLKNNNDYDDDYTSILSEILSWCLLSTNRELRDKSTKILIKLLHNKIDLLLKLLTGFKDINDPYISERLYAVAYGCTIRTNQIDKLPDLGIFIYNSIFNKKGEIYPHILLRDYARNSLEYMNEIGVLPKDIEITKSRPPYKSKFPLILPSNKIIDLFTPKYDSIKSSMTTEYGRGTGWYGDFGRYVFQSALQHWNVNYDKLSNWCVLKIYMKYKYSKKSFGDFDKSIGSGRARASMPNERIGKKYQWIMFYEALARTADNKSPAEKYSDIQDKYNGPWMPYVRDIDPTMLIQQTCEIDESSDMFWWRKIPYNNWDLPNWDKLKSDIPDLKEIILQNYESKNLLLLDGDVIWKEAKGELGSKSIWFRIQSYIINKNDFSDAKEHLQKQNFYNDRLPDVGQLYQVFSREYYWSPAYKDFNSDYYEQIETNDLITSSGVNLGKIYSTHNNFLWEEEFDYSKEESIHFMKPSDFILTKMSLKYSRKEGEFLNASNELVCFDPAVNNNMKSALFIDLKEFENFLNENNYVVFWAVIGEKHSKMSITDLSAFYYFENGTIKGKIQ